MDSMKNSIQLYKNWLSMAKLMPKQYQIDGVSKMLDLEIHGSSLFPGLHGGFLCDEMGLGKTIQILGLIYSNLQKRTLIVLPNALLDQWETEIIRLFGHKPFVYHGSKKHLPGFEDALIVLTTYGTFATRTVKKTTVKSKLLDFKWDRVIFDEAHHLRNKKTGAFHAADNLNVDIRWFVTGTPTQNKIQDIYSLCHLLGIHKDKYHGIDNLSMVSDAFKIGRSKKDVGIHLPQLTVDNIYVDWESDSEMTLAKDLHSVFDFTNVTCGNVDLLIQLLTDSHLPALLRMRQSCILPELIKDKVDMLVQDGIIDSIDHTTHGRSKINAIVKHILSSDVDNKKIVFCHFRKEIRLLTSILSSHGLNVAFIDGRVSHSKRFDILSKTHNVLILQIQTANEGLNLQNYNHIYFSSPHWNPAIEDQAIARAHRIGQTKPVNVFRFIMNGFGTDSLSIDSYVHSIQHKKRELYKLF
jgi:SNF2 family DNA or RNA helicase